MKCCVTQGGGKESPPRGGEARGVPCWGEEGSEQDHGVALQNQAKPKLPLAALATLSHQTKSRRCLQQGKSQRLNERGKGQEALRGTGYFTGPNTPQPNKAKKSPRYLVLYNSIPSGIVPRGSQDQLALLTGTVHQPTGKRQCTRADGGLQGDEANNVTITRPSV